ncbi:Anti-sigma-28 factor FlgM family protein [Desulfarculus baarsii DSM 2075]|uniref:Negative regulator of flagellin synthesis n=1 Tax=Desulfarculus baarsii (strain ATCC 33931 / DSM 2075 / LMG 7858 / VKM B-1802 / 2st14) TaxID=644282 RepID=E1QJF9_DESB2|nr:flagellar biosynthesis anti-sigma factor FlgM [Desulfarculus baarsii]ADK85702.1 Anti-sigma-28 factor FlgM family protein [Desulfarculus baarsii DSM 2075]
MLIKDTLGVRDKALEGRDGSSRVGKSGAKVTSASVTDSASAAEDTVALSNRSKELARAHEAVVNAPDVRRQKIEELKRQVANNEYQVNAEQVAHRMIVDFLGELV